MNYELVAGGKEPYVASRVGDGVIDSESAALDLVSACGEYQTHRLLVESATLPEAFYQLRTGLAGTIMLKFSTYSLKVAFMVPYEKITQGRFGEMAQEANRRNNMVHFFQDAQLAEDWLVR